MSDSREPAATLAKLQIDAEKGRTEYAKDPRFAQLVELFGGLSVETFAMMWMDAERGHVALLARCEEAERRAGFWMEQAETADRNEEVAVLLTIEQRIAAEAEVARLTEALQPLTAEADRILALDGTNKRLWVARPLAEAIKALAARETAE